MKQQIIIVAEPSESPMECYHRGLNLFQGVKEPWELLVLSKGWLWQQVTQLKMVSLGTVGL